MLNYVADSPQAFPPHAAIQTPIQALPPHQTNLWRKVTIYGRLRSLPVRDLDYTRLTRQGSTTSPLSWQGNVDYRKIALDYATLGRAFRNCFPFENVFPWIHKYDDRENN